jgi:hypothetical protein
VIALHVHRVPSTWHGRAVDLALRVIGTRFFTRDLRETVKRIEAAS